MSSFGASYVKVSDYAKGRNRRLARDCERYPTTVAAFVRLAMILCS